MTVGTCSRLRCALALAAAALAMGALLGACAPNASRLAFESSRRPVQVKPAFTTQVYSMLDENTVDIYLTDVDALGVGDPGPRATGHLVHIHMFLLPRAGRTPIDATASNVTITHLVLADGAYGIYGGGGFLLPSSKPGRRSFGGRLADATLKFVGAAGAFSDRLGWNEVAGGVAASRDDQRAGAIASWLAAAWANPKLVRVPPPADP